MICEKCKNKHDGNYGSGRFCSSVCARSFSSMEKREEINKKVSKTLLKRNEPKRLARIQSKEKKKRERKARMIHAESPYSDYYLYTIFHSGEKRMMAHLYKDNENRKIMSYSRYLMSVKLERVLGKDEHVDHIDGNKLNDSLENLQILSPGDNQRKYREIDNPAPLKGIVCPVCKEIFFDLKCHMDYKINNQKSVCCSRKCSAINKRKTA